MNSDSRIFALICLMLTYPWLSIAQPQTIAPSQSINNAFSLWEMDHSGGRHDFNPQMSNFNVDINSIIKIEPVPNIVQTLGRRRFAAVDQANADSASAFDKQKKSFLELLENIDEQIQLSKALQNIVLQLQTVQSDSERQRLKQELSTTTKMHGRIGTQRAAAITSYLIAKGYTINQARGHLSEIEVRGTNFAPLAAFLRAQIIAIDSMLVRESEKIMDGAGRTAIMMSASLFQNGNRSPIHLPGYDTYDSGEPHLVRKVSFDLTTAEQKRLDEEYEFALHLSTAVNDIRKNGDATLAGLIDQGRLLVNSVDSLLKGFGSFQAILLSEVEEKLQMAQALSTADGDPRLTALNSNYAKLEEKIKTLKKTIEKVQDSVVSFRDKVLNPAPNSTPVASLTRMFDNLKQSYKIIDEAVQLFINDQDEITTLLKSIVDELARVEATALKELTTDIQTVFLSSPIVLTIRGNIECIKKLHQEVDALTSASRDVELTDGIRPDILHSSSHLRRQLNDVTNTEINLLKTDREEGDIVELTIQVTDGETIIESREVIFEISKYGLVTGVSANAVFLTAMPEDFRGNAQFLMSPVATFMFYYRPWNWDFSPVGIGIHTTTPKFNPDVSVEIGIGGSIHFFGDILQAGIGVDISTHPSPGYWYVGLGILDFLSRVKGK